MSSAQLRRVESLQLRNKQVPLWLPQSKHESYPAHGPHRVASERLRSSEMGI